MNRTLSTLMRTAFLPAAALLACSTTLAATLTYTTVLTGAAEDTPNASPGTGTATLVLDDIARSLSLDVAFGGLLGTVTAAHIHCCTTSAGTGTAGVVTVTPTFTGFPAGVTSGNYNRLFDMTVSAGSWNTGLTAFLNGTHGGNTTSAFAALVTGLDEGKAYLNIHTNQFPAGEIRGFFNRVPEPSTAWLLLPALLGGLVTARRRAPAAGRQVV